MHECIYSSIHLSIHPSIHLPARLFIYPSFRVPTYLSIDIFILLRFVTNFWFLHPVSSPCFPSSFTARTWGAAGIGRVHENRSRARASDCLQRCPLFSLNSGTHEECVCVYLYVHVCMYICACVLYLRVQLENGHPELKMAGCIGPRTRRTRAAWALGG